MKMNLKLELQAVTEFCLLKMKEISNLNHFRFFFDMIILNEEIHNASATNDCYEHKSYGIIALLIAHTHTKQNLQCRMNSFCAQ